jgi:hypothetical protein
VALLAADDRLTDALRRRFEPGRLVVEAGEVERARGPLAALAHRGSLDVPTADVRAWSDRLSELARRLDGGPGR